MHIVICTSSYPDRHFSSGQEAAGAFVQEFAKQLSKHCRVTVVAPSLSESAESDGNLCIQYFRVPSLPLSLLKPYRPDHWLKILQTLKAGQQAIDRLLTEQPIGHVVAFWALPCGYWARAACRKTGKPYSIWALGSDIWELGKWPVIRQILARVLKDARHRFADGYQLAKDTESIGGKSCDFLPSSRKLPERKQKIVKGAPPFKLAFLGRWHPNKGADLLIDALNLLNDQDWARIEHIRYCGGGKLESAIRKRIDELANTGKPISLSGYLDQEQATDLYHWADYLMLPSRIESIPVIFSDAMQCGCPIVSTPIGDMPRLLAEFSCGLLAEETSADAFANALRQALHTKPDDYSSGIAQAAKQFDTGETAELLFEHLRQSSKT